MRKGFTSSPGMAKGPSRSPSPLGGNTTIFRRRKEYAHPAAVVLLTPEGRVSRYLTGLQYDPTDLRVGLLEASEGRGLNVAEQAVVYCYRYDPESGRIRGGCGEHHEARRCGSGGRDRGYPRLALAARVSPASSHKCGADRFEA